MTRKKYSELNECDDIQHLSELLPAKCKIECSQSGQVIQWVRRWVKELGLNVPREKCIEELENYGAWNDLEDKTNSELNEIYLWLAAGYET